MSAQESSLIATSSEVENADQTQISATDTTSSAITELCTPLLLKLSNQQSHEQLHPNEDARPNIINIHESNEPSSPTFLGLLFYRAIYFLDGLSASTWGRFGIIYYNRVARLSPFQIGILEGFAPLICLFSVPFWGYVADYVQSRKRIFLLCRCLNIFLLSTLGMVRPTFLLILMCVCGMSVFRAGGVMDAAVLDYLGEAKEMYGTIRLWTSVSWGVGGIVMGYITDSYGFRWNFWLFGIMMSAMVGIVAWGLPARSRKEQEQYDRCNRCDDGNSLSESTTSMRFWGEVIPVIRRPPVLLWLAQIVILGIGMSLVDSFLFVYLQNDLNASTTMCGFTIGITVIFEIPILHYSKWFLSNIGHDILYIMAMLAYIIRVFGYTILTESTVYWVLPLEGLHGITFACSWIAAVDYAAFVAPENWSTTFQAIMRMFQFNLATFLGSFVGGWVIQQYSAVIMYRGMAAIVSLLLTFHLVFLFFFRQGHCVFLRRLKQEREDECRERLVAGDNDRIAIK